MPPGDLTCSIGKVFIGFTLGDRGAKLIRVKKFLSLCLAVFGALALIIGGMLLIAAAAEETFQKAFGAGFLIFGTVLIFSQSDISLKDAGVGILGKLRAALAARGEIGFKEIYGAIVHGEPERLAFLQAFAVYYSIAGFILGLAAFRFVAVMFTQAVLRGTGGLIALAGGLFFANLCLHREALGIKGKAGWAKALALFAAAVFFSAQYALWLNCLQVSSRDVTYSGVVEEKEITRIHIPQRRSGSAGDAVLGGIAFLFLERTAYNVYLRDSATAERIKLRVKQEDYARLRKGDSFAQTAHLGRLGAPYRWFWE